MPIDPNIALSFKPAVALADPMQQYGRAQEVQANAMALRQARSENALAQQAALDKQVMNKLYSEAYDPKVGGIDYNKLASRAVELGKGSAVPVIQAQRQESEAKTETVRKDFLANVKSAMENSRYRLEGVTTPEQAMQWHEQNHNDPTLKKYFSELGITAEQARAQIAAVAGNPPAFADMLQKMQLGLEKAQQAVDNRLTREVTTRGQDIQATTTQRGQDIQASTTRRGQDIQATTTRRGQDFQASAIGQVIKNDDGSSTLVNNQGKVVSTLKPAAGAKANTSREKLSGTLDQLAGYYTTLKAQGAAVSSETGGPLANIVARTRNTLAGEAVEGLLGTKAQTARDAIRMTRPMIVASLKEALGLSAQQLNSNKELQLWLDAATDPTKSYEANMDALNNLARVTGTKKTYGASAAQSAPAAGDVLQYDASGKRK